MFSPSCSVPTARAEAVEEGKRGVSMVDPNDQKIVAQGQKDRWREIQDIGSPG